MSTAKEESALRAQLEAQSQARVQKCVAAVQAILKEFGVRLDARVTIQGASLQSEVLFIAE